MNQIFDTSPRALREAFYILSTAQDMPNATLLDDVIRRYPRFSEELTEFAIAIAIDALRGDQAVDAAETAINPNVVSPAVSRAMSHFQNRLHALTTSAGMTPKETARSAGLDAPNPFLGLPRTEFRALAVRLNANSVFVSKLRDRQIDSSTMTQGFQTRVAGELGVPVEVVAAHFAAEQVIPAGQFFKAEGKPSIGSKQTFGDAVRNSGLTDDQQQSLLDL